MTTIDLGQCGIKRLPFAIRCTDSATHTIEWGCVHEHFCMENICTYHALDMQTATNEFFCEECFDLDNHLCPISILELTGLDFESPRR